jgi:HSP20 family protein
MAEAATKEAKARSESASVPVRRSSAPATIERDLFEDFFEDFGRGLFHLPRILRRRPWPAVSELHLPRLASVDVYDTKDEVVVKAELAGIAKDDIDVTVNGSTITIKGEKKEEREVKEEDYHRSERSFGMVSRTVELPAEVRSDQASAKLHDGVLEVRIPKTDEAKARAVKVKVQ